MILLQLNQRKIHIKRGVEKINTYCRLRIRGENMCAYVILPNYCTWLTQLDNHKWHYQISDKNCWPTLVGYLSHPPSLKRDKLFLRSTYLSSEVKKANSYSTNFVAFNYYLYCPSNLISVLASRFLESLIMNGYINHLA